MPEGAVSTPLSEFRIISSDLMSKTDSFQLFLTHKTHPLHFQFSVIFFPLSKSCFFWSLPILFPEFMLWKHSCFFLFTWFCTWSTASCAHPLAARDAAASRDVAPALMELQAWWGRGKRALSHLGRLAGGGAPRRVGPRSAGVSCEQRPAGGWSCWASSWDSR